MKPNVCYGSAAHLGRCSVDHLLLIWKSLPCHTSMKKAGGEEIKMWPERNGAHYKSPLLTYFTKSVAFGIKVKPIIYIKRMEFVKRKIATPISGFRRNLLLRGQMMITRADPECHRTSSHEFSMEAANADVELVKWDWRKGRFCGEGTYAVITALAREDWYGIDKPISYIRYQKMRYHWWTTIYREHQPFGNFNHRVNGQWKNGEYFACRSR